MHRILPDPASPYVPRRARGRSPWAALLLAIAGLPALAARGEQAVKGPVLGLSNGGFALGQWGDSDRPGSLRWQSPAFAGPFDFDVSVVESIRFPVADAAPRPAGHFGFELAGGDVLYGSLATLDDKTAELVVPRIGKVRVDRARLHRIFRWNDGADLVYNGPNGLSGWREMDPPRLSPNPLADANKFGVRIRAAAPRPAPAPAAPEGPKWKESSGQILTDKEGAVLQSDVALPARAAIDLELSWNSRPDFVLALGVGDDEATAGRAFRFEVWDGRIVALRETETEADLASIQPAAPGQGRAHLRCLLDQDQGRLLVNSAAGEPLADLKVGAGGGPVLGGVRLANIHGGVRLERLRIGPWDGRTPRSGEADQGRIQLTDGSTADGLVVRYDADAAEFVLAGQDGESRVARDRVVGVQVSPRAEEPARVVRVAHADGSQLSGDWGGVERGAMVLKVPGFADPVRISPEGLRSIEWTRREARPPAGDVATGTLELDGVRLPGALADDSAGGLAWKPLGAASARPILPGASGRVLYRRAPSGPVINRVVARRVVPAVGVPGRSNPAPAVDRSLPPIPPSARRVFLRTGDVVPSEVTKIDEAGVTIRSTITGTTFIPNDRIKAVELAAEAASAVRVDKSKRERLLTLPRMQKDGPPTHLIRSRNGDFLRGRIVSMDDKTIRIEVRLEEKDVPRDRVSRIIWLHPDETDPAKAPRPASGEGPPRVQAIRNDGMRITFLADRFADATLFGKSDVLGDCKVRAEDLDTLLIGPAIEQDASRLAYQQWKLHNAPEPKSALADAGGPSSGTESPLVGKPAPDFTLDLLAGKAFHLADHKGKVVVLDFWATWCGPCLQAMPQIDRATRDFADKGVVLVAVNLQEAPAQISAMLERQKLSPSVALDRDGAVAEKYAAHAIPQTVVIDRDGKVSRLFIGGGPHLEGQIREALKALSPGVKE